MPQHESDISWQVLRRVVQEWAGMSAELAEVKPLVGGVINNTLALRTEDGARAVLKISAHRVNRDYEREAHQLRHLRRLGLPAPEVYLCQIGSLDDPFSYLLMEFVEGVDLAEAKKRSTAAEYDQLQQHLAEIVLSLHQHTAGQYGRVLNGQTAWFEHWAPFYRHVYDAIWHEAEKDKSLPVKARKQIARVHEKLERLIGHDDRPRLVHWDIWATNLLVRQDGGGRWQVAALLDPNSKFAHFEAEIAYMELFHTITPAFLKAYQRSHKLPADYHRLRKCVYQLYPLINHFRLFGNEYLRPLTAAVERVSAVV